MHTDTNTESHVASKRLKGTQTDREEQNRAKTERQVERACNSTLFSVQGNSKKKMFLQEQLLSLLC
jgi:hypothetical protein